jgi:hypothetical protein
MGFGGRQEGHDASLVMSFLLAFGVHDSVRGI